MYPDVYKRQYLQRTKKGGCVWVKINHKYDIYGRTEPSIIYLAKPGKRLYCALGGIDTSTASLSLKTNNTAELTFTVDKYINNTVTDGYEELDELMELYCDGIWFKIVDPPTINNDGLRETKEITACLLYTSRCV